MRTLAEKIRYILWCVFGILGGVALSICIVVKGAEFNKNVEADTQKVHQHIIEQIESANSHPVYVLNGEYNATRCDKPYQHCVRLCKLMKFSYAGAGDEGMRQVWEK